ncbi:MAG: alanine--tRNA ligase, partial [Proteobacteria bacterium]
GVRRIEAATGLNALSYLQKVEGSLAKVARTLKSSPDDVGEKVERLFEQNRTLEKELAEAKKKAALGGGSSGGGVDGMLAQAKSFGDAKALAVRLDDLDAKTARELADQLRDRLGNAAVLVASSVGGKAQLVVTVAKTLSDRAKAGDLVRDIAKVVSGSGGGRPDMAQAGGTDPGQIPAAMELFYGKVGEALGHPS